jgi:site-specific recombinase XerD
MAIYKKAGRDVYSYDFRNRGKRFSGTTGETSKRGAERPELQIRAQADRAIYFDGNDLTIEAALAKWFDEIGQHHKNISDTLAALDWIIKRIGKIKLADLSNRDVASLVANRRGENVSNATVNRTVTEPLRAMHRRAAMVWEHPARQIDWRSHKMREPAERVRELTAFEELKLFEQLRDDYHPIIQFDLIYGLRLQELLDLEWRNVDWHAAELTVVGKGDRVRTIELEQTGIDILRSFATGRVDGRLMATNGTQHNCMSIFCFEQIKAL